LISQTANQITLECEQNAIKTNMHIRLADVDGKRKAYFTVDEIEHAFTLQRDNLFAENPHHPGLLTVTPDAAPDQKTTFNLTWEMNTEGSIVLKNLSIQPTQEDAAPYTVFDGLAVADEALAGATKYVAKPLLQVGGGIAGLAGAPFAAIVMGVLFSYPQLFTGDKSKEAQPLTGAIAAVSALCIMPFAAAAGAGDLADKMENFWKDRGIHNKAKGKTSSSSLGSN
jgi:hypothetical protein